MQYEMSSVVPPLLLAVLAALVVVPAPLAAARPLGRVQELVEAKRVLLLLELQTKVGGVNMRLRQDDEKVL